MANWYHCSMKVIGRSGAGSKSSVAACAYRLGENLYDERTQTHHDYTRRSGVEASFTLAPSTAPDWATDPQKLWNAAEAAEKRINSQTAREWVIALPSEVSKEEREEITRGLGEHLTDRYGVAVTAAIHEPSRQGDDRNYHAHILTTTRRMGADGLGEKTRELVNMKTGAVEILHIREYTAELINTALERAGIDDRVDHRSFKDRGIDQEPTEHLGVAATAIERRGEPSRIGDENRGREQANQHKSALAQESEALDRQIAAARAEILEFKPEPEAQAKPVTHWQDHLTAEREGEGGSGGGFRPADPPANTSSSITDPVNVFHADQIATQGEIQHKGLVKHWVEHALEWVHDWDESIAEGWELLKDEIKGGGAHDMDEPQADYWQQQVKAEPADNPQPRRLGGQFDAILEANRKEYKRVDWLEEAQKHYNYYQEPDNEHDNDIER
ncbi:MobQ family relaxase [Methylovulum psychrotolerans]|uniref:Mobilization protein A n=1 Tax=Methylovulum psychrotolerans TaxID=1704499 RepID=A0A2S5CFG9_9GAMM|nr:MobQ family relaxase [Methylovulum psychrotolerans]POZ49553.1 Mobilization protein A [Methylovulum psychrotolerans]